MKTHNIKLNKIYAYPILWGDKTFEIRLNDRNYQVGDIISFCVVDDNNKFINHPLNMKKFIISYILNDFHLDDKYIAFSIKPIKNNL